MSRGLSYGGGQSSLGYLLGSSEPPTKPTTATTSTTTTVVTKLMPEERQIAAGVRGSPNNYLRSDGQNCGNFLTDRLPTKVHAAPGGGSSLGYLFGGNGGAGN